MCSHHLLPILAWHRNVARVPPLTTQKPEFPDCLCLGSSAPRPLDSALSLWADPMTFGDWTFVFWKLAVSVFLLAPAFVVQKANTQSDDWDSESKETKPYSRWVLFGRRHFKHRVSLRREPQTPTVTWVLQGFICCPFLPLKTTCTPGTHNF